LWQRCLSRRHGYLIPLSWRMVPGSLFDTRRSLSSGPGPDTSRQLDARDGNLMPITQLLIPCGCLVVLLVVIFIFVYFCSSARTRPSPTIGGGGQGYIIPPTLWATGGFGVFPIRYPSRTSPRASDPSRWDHLRVYIMSADRTKRPARAPTNPMQIESSYVSYHLLEEYHAVTPDLVWLVGWLCFSILASLPVAGHRRPSPTIAPYYQNTHIGRHAPDEDNREKIRSLINNQGRPSDCVLLGLLIMFCLVPMSLRLLFESADVNRHSDSSRPTRIDTDSRRQTCIDTAIQVGRRESTHRFKSADVNRRIGSSRPT
jgi:hypothetical protein